MQERKRTKAGTEDYERLILSNGYYVDKTRFLRPLLEDTGDVVLFTRPRRFGKTLTMTMLRDFLKVDRESPGSTKLQERLFKGLDVMEDRDLCSKFMGQHPVLFITLKDIDGDDFAGAVDRFADAVSTIARGLDFLNESPKLSDKNRHDLEILMSRQALKAEDDLGTLKSSLALLATMLFKHYGRQVAVLIDEYDVPLAKAQQKGFHRDMVTFYSGFLSLLKLRNWEQGNPIFKIVMTGCLRGAKNQIFTGANNFTPYTVVSRGSVFSTLFGFTPKETEDYLSAFGLSGCLELAREHYDGYLFDGDEIFNPWDVAKFAAAAMEAREKAEFTGRRWSAAEAGIAACNYWLGSESTGTTAIKDYVGTLSRDDNQRLQDLSDGGEVEVEINDDMNYDCLDERKASDMWSLLLHTGYLTATKVITSRKCVVKIPNKEIKECFDDSILESFKDSVRSAGDDLDLGLAILRMDGAKAEEIIGRTLGTYVENRFKATRSPRENFYEGYMLGILSCSRSISNLKLEKQSGMGFADIVFSKSGCSDMVVVEFKAAPAPGAVRESARKAVSQIIDKEYAREYVVNDTIGNVLAAGIAFYGRGACVEFKALKGACNGAHGA